jgi:hypothetical protein
MDFEYILPGNYGIVDLRFRHKTEITNLMKFLERYLPDQTDEEQTGADEKETGTEEITETNKRTELKKKLKKTLFGTEENTGRQGYMRAIGCTLNRKLMGVTEMGSHN